MLIKEKTIWTPDNSYLLEYHARIECGEIIVGQELWQELENLKADFLNDMFFYDTSDALLRMDFMEKCVRLTKSPYYNKPMILMLWQKAFIEAIYSFKMSETTLRRFKKIILLIARKNTKSETCSALGLSELILGNEGSDIVASSNDDMQASIIYDAIDTMRQLIDPNDLDTKRNQRFILNKVTNSKVFKLSERTRAKEGRNIDVGFLDESHEMKENVIAKSIEQSQSLKDEPLFFNLTTEGFIVDGYLDKELEFGRKVISGEDDGISAIRTLPWLYTQDSEQEIWQNRNSWVKSNPTLGIVKKWDYLDEQIDLARKSKSDRMFVLCKDFNIKCNSVESWLNIEDYNYKATFDLEDFRNCICLGAVDLSETTDLTCAKILLMKPNDKTKYIYTKYFIPESKIDNSDDWNAGARYKEWVENGLMTMTEGNDIDLAVVADWFYSLYQEYNIKLWKCGYDQRFSKDWINRMDVYGWTKANEDLILILQNAQTLSNAMKLCEADFKHQLINYGENVVDKWCLKNAGIKVDDKAQCLCIKQEASKRIDGAVTFIILYEMYRRYRTEFKQMIEVT
jgi:phage terminase large subunit-like protein